MIQAIKEQLRNAGFFRGSKYDHLRDRIFTGHVSIGPVTIYGANAMHYGVTVSTGRGYICFRPTTGKDGHWPWYLYVSPNATPGSAWWGTGPGFDGMHDVEDRIERAFWRFDALHKAHYRDVAEWLPGPMSERDAFKYAVRNMGAPPLAGEETKP